MADIITQNRTISVELTNKELDIVIKMISDMKVAGTIDDLPNGIAELRMLRGKFIEALQRFADGAQTGEQHDDSGDQ